MVRGTKIKLESFGSLIALKGLLCIYSRGDGYAILAIHYTQKQLVDMEFEEVYKEEEKGE